MRNLLIISILVISSSSRAQDYVANWVTTKEIGVINFQVQKSSDKVNWATLPNGTLSPKKKDTNRYTFTLPLLATIYYTRIKTLFTDTILYSSSKKVVNTNVAITKAILKINTGSDNLSFTATNEAAVDYYSIERQNSSSSKWVLAGKLKQEARKNYQVNITKIGSNRKYKMIAYYKTKIVSSYISFQ